MTWLAIAIVAATLAQVSVALGPSLRILPALGGFMVLGPVGGNLAGSTAATAIGPLNGVLGRVLVALTAMSPARPLVAKIVDPSRATPPLANFCRMSRSPLWRRQLPPHFFAGTIGSARPTSPVSIGSTHGVLFCVFVPLQAMRLARVVVSAVASLVAIVAGWRVIAKVVQPVVSPNSVVVAHLHAFRAGADKGLHNEPVDISCAATDGYHPVSLTRHRLFKNSTG